MDGFFTFFIFLDSILVLMLFIKIWIMTNDVRVIKNAYLNDLKKKVNEGKSSIPDKSMNGIKAGDLVVRLKDEKQMRVQEYSNGKFYCKHDLIENEEYDPYEIEPFDVHFKK